MGPHAAEGLECEAPQVKPEVLEPESLAETLQPEETLKPEEAETDGAPEKLEHADPNAKDSRIGTDLTCE